MNNYKVAPELRGIIRELYQWYSDHSHNPDDPCTACEASAFSREHNARRWQMRLELSRELDATEAR